MTIIVVGVSIKATDSTPYGAKRCPIGTIGTYPYCKCQPPSTGMPPNCKGPESPMPLPLEFLPPLTNNLANTSPVVSTSNPASEVQLPATASILQTLGYLPPKVKPPVDTSGYLPPTSGTKPNKGTAGNNSQPPNFGFLQPPNAL